MVLPLLAAGIGAGGSIISGIMGANAANKADDTNWEINLLNYYQREREREDRIRESAANKRDSKLGVTDGDGSRIKFVEGVGWVTDLADTTKAIQDGQQQEQLNVLQKDLPMKRRAMARNEARSLEDEGQADALRRDMKSIRRNDDSALEGLLYQAATNGMGTAFDESQRATVAEAARTGSSNIGKLLSGINTDRAKAYADAAMEAKLRARGSGDAEFESKRSSLANLYNMFATRASVAPDVSYAPQAVSKSADGFTSQMSKQGMDAGNQLAAAFGAKGGAMDYVQPNYGAANAVGSGARALGSMFKTMTFGDDAGGGSTYDKNQYRKAQGDF